MALKRGTVKLENYQDNWNTEYEKERELLLKVLKDYIKEIHHVGSTSIKGLKSKPIIDILIVIDNLNQIPEIEKILNNYNYSNRGTHGIEDRYFFAKGSEEARTHYLHITLNKSDTYYNQLYFKKYLTDHPEYIEKYCNIKEELASKYPEERAKYTEGKSAFISNIINLAKNEYDN